MLTVDTPILGRRLADTRNRFQLPSHLKLELPSSFFSDTYCRFENFASVAQEKMPSASNESSAFMNYVSGQIDPTLTWKDVKELTKYGIRQLSIELILSDLQINIPSCNCERSHESGGCC